LCEQCRHCPGYFPPPANPDPNVQYTIYGSDLADCGICADRCDNKDITVYSNGKGMTDNHVNALEISNVVSS